MSSPRPLTLTLHVTEKFPKSLSLTSTLASPCRRVVARDSFFFLLVPPASLWSYSQPHYPLLAATFTCLSALFGQRRLLSRKDKQMIARNTHAHARSTRARSNIMRMRMSDDCDVILRKTSPTLLYVMGVTRTYVHKINTTPRPRIGGSCVQTSPILAFASSLSFRHEDPAVGCCARRLRLRHLVG